MRCTVEIDKPEALAIERVLQWVAAAGIVSNVVVPTSAIFSSPILRGAPGRLALPGLPRILAEPDLDALAVMGSRIEQQSLDVARIGPPANHIQQPIAAIPIAAELDADGPVRVIELGLLGRGEIPIADDIEIGRDLVDDGAPFPLE